jgi:hypothetical protein
MSIFLNKKLSNNPKFILADYTMQSSVTKYGWNPGDSFYNDLNLTKEFSRLHGLENFDLLDLQTDELGKLKDVDLIMSFLSVGFHYPIENYIKTLLNIATEDCTMIFGIRSGIYTAKNFEAFFKNISFEKNKINSKEEILILSHKKS